MRDWTDALDTQPPVRSARSWLGRMKLQLSSLFVAAILFLMILNSCSPTFGHPVSNADAVVENMRQIPQWHCLRYRKFDLVKRCRNYRVMMRRQ